MKSYRDWGAQAILAVLLSASMISAWADRGGRGGENHREGHHGHGYNHDFDARYHHNRYYPSLGVVVDIVPPGFYEVPYRGSRYFFQGGVWYRSQGPRFVVVTPPIGLAVSILPPFYTTLWVGGSPYYYADGVYYAWRPAQRTYVVVDAPRESDVLALPAEVSQQFVYPKNGQNEQQQAQDQYECHRWAVTQTGFDPTQPNAETTPPDATRRDDYQRATKACLDGRGYSVR